MCSDKRNLWETIFKIISYVATAIAGALGSGVLQSCANM